MCNLSVGIYKKGWNDGWNDGWKAAQEAIRSMRLQQEQERDRRLISMLWEMHMDIPTIAWLAKCPEEEVCGIAKELGLR